MNVPDMAKVLNHLRRDPVVKVTLALMYFVSVLIWIYSVVCFVSVCIHVYMYKMHRSIPCSSIADSSTCSSDSHDIVDLGIEMRTETGHRKTVIANWLDCL